MKKDRKQKKSSDTAQRVVKPLNENKSSDAGEREKPRDGIWDSFFLSDESVSDDFMNERGP